MKKNEKNIKPKEKKVNKHWGIVYGLIAFFVIGPIITIIVLTQPNNKSNNNINQDDESIQESSNNSSSSTKGYVNNTFPIVQLSNGNQGTIAFFKDGTCFVDFHKFAGSSKISGVGTMYLTYLPENCRYTDNDNIIYVNATAYYKEIYEFRDGLKQLHSKTISEQRVLPPSFQLEYNPEKDTIKILTQGQFKLNGAEGYQKVHFVVGDGTENYSNDDNKENNNNSKNNSNIISVNDDEFKENNNSTNNDSPTSSVEFSAEINSGVFGDGETEDECWINISVDNHDQEYNKISNLDITLDGKSIYNNQIVRIKTEYSDDTIVKMDILTNGEHVIKIKNNKGYEYSENISFYSGAKCS